MKLSRRSTNNINNFQNRLILAIIILSLICGYLIWYGINVNLNLGKAGINCYIKRENCNLFNLNSADVVDCKDAAIAPDGDTIGLWKGDGNIHDGKSDYYITHDGTSWGQKILDAQEGDAFTIIDASANISKIYEIYDIIYVDGNCTTYDDVKEIAMPGNETAAIQVCIPGTHWYRIAIAK